MKSWKTEIGVERESDGLGLSWFDAGQLRQSLAFVAALVRRLEGVPDGAAVGAREERIATKEGSAPAVPDLAALSDEELELVRRRWIQDAAITVSGAPTGYRLTTDGVRHGLIGLTVPEERVAAFDATIDAFLAAYAAEHGVPLRATWRP